MSYEEQKKRIKDLFESNVSDENAQDFVNEVAAIQSTKELVTSVELCEAILDLIFDPLEDTIK